MTKTRRTLLGANTKKVVARSVRNDATGTPIVTELNATSLMTGIVFGGKIGVTKNQVTPRIIKHAENLNKVNRVYYQNKLKKLNHPNLLFRVECFNK